MPLFLFHAGSVSAEAARQARVARRRCTRSLAVALGVLLSVGASGLVGCDRRPSPPHATGSASNAAAVASAAERESPVEPAVLVELPVSAYHATIATDEEAAYVLTAHAAYRLVPGEPPTSMPLELSYGAALSRDSFVYWSDGAVWRAPKRGGTAERVGPLPEQPKFFVASGDALGWLAGRGHDFLIQKFEGRRPVTVYATSSSDIDAMILVQDWFFFVERAKDASWRIGRVRAPGTAPAYTPSKTGSTPALLAVEGDTLYYYYSGGLQVRRLSPDFLRDQVVAERSICSPIAVSTAFFCGRVEGLFEILGAAPPRRLTNNGARLITGIAANARWVVWLTDSGPERLTVKALPAQRGG